LSPQISRACCEQYSSCARPAVPPTKASTIASSTMPDTFLTTCPPEALLLCPNLDTSMEGAFEGDPDGLARVLQQKTMAYSRCTQNRSGFAFYREVENPDR
jgi:hypothetical protein